LPSGDDHFNPPLFSFVWRSFLFGILQVRSEATRPQGEACEMHSRANGKDGRDDRKVEQYSCQDAGINQGIDLSWYFTVDPFVERFPLEGFPSI
jgi:hypothetical protein